MKINNIIKNNRLKILSLGVFLISVVAQATSGGGGFTDSLNRDLTALCGTISCVDYSNGNEIISSNGTRIAVKDFGPNKKNGPTILFIHGYPHGQGLWIEQVKSKPLRQGFRIVTMDVRGGGDSDVPDPGNYEGQNYGDDIKAVIDTLGLKNVILVGHSHGGVVLTGYLANYGQSQLRGVVWVSSFADLLHAFIPASTFEIVVNTLSNDPVIYAQATSDFADASHFVPFSSELSTKVLNMDFETTLLGRIGQLTASFVFADNTAYIESITVPSLVVQGANDIVILPETADYIQSHLTSSKKVTRVDLAGVGHLPMLESPDAFNKALLKFVSNF